MTEVDSGWIRFVEQMDHFPLSARAECTGCMQAREYLQDIEEDRILEAQHFKESIERKDKQLSKKKKLIEKSKRKCFDAEKLSNKKTKQLQFLRKFDPSPADPAFEGDVTFLIHCDQEPKPTVHAHRFMLESRSSVFRKMFKTDMMERQSGEIHIKDLTEAVLRALVVYLYEGEVDFTYDASPEELLKAAHKYDIPELKADCEEELCKRIDKESLFELLKLSHKYQATNLQKQALEYLGKNFDDVKGNFADIYT